jgi:murein DD-endopeptidase MepM/ murein hydrolase activator NlpD
MSRRRFRGAVPLAVFAAFLAGIVVDGWLRTYGPPKPAEDAVRLQPDTTAAKMTDVPKAPAPGASVVSGFPPPPKATARLAEARSAREGGSRTSPGDQPSASGDQPSATSGSLPSTHLRLPLDGANVESLKGGFAEKRGNRPHEAVDMLAPRNTPVHAVENGTIAKLFTSKAGGLTIYQFDATQRLCYYYAHLERYAAGLRDGQVVSKGDVIGYVGTSGNAPPDTPHLHFAVFELNADKHWWQGKAIDPYLVFKDRS